MRRLRRVAIFASAETLGRAATWLTVFLLPWILAPDEYGIVVLLVSFEALATGLLMLGQNRAVMWRGAAEVELGEQEPWVATAAAIAVVAGAIGSLFVVAASILRIERVLGVPVWPHLYLLSVAVVCVNVNRIILAFVRVTERADDFAGYRVATGMGRLVATLGLAGLTGSSIAFPAGAALGTVAGGGRLWRRILRGTWDRASMMRGSARSMLRYGAPLSLHAVAGNAINYVDRWIIGSMLGLAAVGSYGWFYVLGSAVAFLYHALNVYYEPAIYREYRQSGSVSTLREYLGICMIAAGTYSLAGVLVASVAGDLVPESVRGGDPRIVRIVLVAHWFYPIYLAANYLLSAVGRTGRVAAMSSTTLVVVLVANLVLIPWLGAVGGAWATLAGTVSLVVTAGVMLRRLRIGARVLIGPTLVISILGVNGALLPGAGGLAAAAAGLIVYGVLYGRGFAGTGRSGITSVEPR